jgi:hypothetical protein
LVVAGAMMAIAAAPVAAQSTLENTLSQFGGETVRGYINPFNQLFAANLGSGFYHSAAIPGGLHLGLEIVAMAAPVKDKHKVYIATTPDGFDPPEFETATVFGGPGTTVTHSGNPALTYRGTDGFIDADYFPWAVPQVRVSIMGFEGTVRYMNSDLIPGLSGEGDDDEEDLPKTTLFGVGVRTGLNTYIPMLPLDVSVGVFWNNFDVGDIMTFSGTSFGAQASKSFRVLTLYGGIASESGTMNLTYTSENPDLPGTVDLDLVVERHVRLTGGLALGFGPFHIFGDASTGGETAYSAGIRLIGF